jgi:hypothetical protein
MKSTRSIFFSRRFIRQELTLLLGIFAVTSFVLAMSEGRPQAVLKNDAASSAPDVPITLNTFTKCGTKNIVYAGRSMKGIFKGTWADWITSVTVSGDGVTASVSNKVGDWDNSSIDVLFNASSTAAAGERTVTAVRGFSSNTFKLTVIPKPSLSGVNPSTLQDYFQTVDVTLRGSNLKGANKASAKARVDSLNPVAGYAGDSIQVVNGTSIPAQVVSVNSDNTEAVVRLVFPQRLTRVSVDVSLTSDGSDDCSPFGSGTGSGPPPTVTRTAVLSAITPTGPFVQSIDSINTSLGSVAEFTITLSRSVPRSSGGLIVFWKMIPSNIFGQVSGDVTYDPSGTLNRTTINTGESIKRIKLSVLSLPPGAGQSGGVAYMETWIGNTNSQEAPYYFKKGFTITKP